MTSDFVTPNLEGLKECTFSIWHTLQYFYLYLNEDRRKKHKQFIKAKQGRKTSKYERRQA